MIQKPNDLFFNLIMHHDSVSNAEVIDSVVKRSILSKF